MSAAVRDVTAAAVASAVAVTVALVVLPDQPTYRVAPVTLTVTVLAWSVVVGPVIGLAGAGFVQFTEWAAAHRASGWRLPAATITVFGVLGALAIPYPQLLGTAKDLPSSPSTEHYRW